jgi:NDP-sugar pyrophosphorylase family protein
MNTRPKPMVLIGGKPFLEYQIEQLREQGFERVLLLLGYLPEVVQDYFGDGRRWGLRIEYLVTAVDDETGRRVKLAVSIHAFSSCIAIITGRCHRAHVGALSRQRSSRHDYRRQQ